MQESGSLSVQAAGSLSGQHRHTMRSRTRSTTNTSPTAMPAMTPLLRDTTAVTHSVQQLHMYTGHSECDL